MEIANIGSINKAAEILLIAQPNLSRCIKELESDLGITIFVRSSKGMLLTPEGEEFISYAKNILKQIDDVEQMYHHGKMQRQNSHFVLREQAIFQKRLLSSPTTLKKILRRYSIMRPIPTRQ